ncbi:MAG: putative DNA-binding domain-containing protein [Archangium sp.]|nr:putative DNA-binding domain-containing protein [Archangium sp.]
MSLAAQQEQLWQWIVGDAAVRDTALLVKAGALSPDERVNVYAEQYWLRLRDVLRGEFEHVRAVLGDDDFDVLAAKYVKAHPSTHFSLNWLGQHLPSFLRAQPVDGAPFLADLAELEWARSQAFIAEDSPVVSAESLSVVTPETAATVRFTLTPSVRVLQHAFDIRPLFRAIADGASWSEIAMPPSPTALVVFRQGFTVFHDAVSSAEAEALTRAMTGATLPELCEAFAEFGDEAASHAFQAIGSWVNEGMVSSLVV